MRAVRGGSSHANITGFPSVPAAVDDLIRKARVYIYVYILRASIAREMYDV